MTHKNSVVAQYNKNKQAAGGNSQKMTQEERFKQYFTTVLPKGETTGKRTIRILPHPTNPGESPFVPVYFHEIQVDGKWMKLYDPKQEGDRSPLNEVHDALMETGLEADRETAYSYRARKFWVVKVIDRDKEEDGVKFWRFKNNAKQEGILDKIVPIYESKGVIDDINEGRDLTLTLNLTKSGNGKEYTTITSIIQDDKSVLHSDPEKVKEWLDVNSTKTWNDVYAKRSVDYLEIVASGEIPKWSTDKGGWVSTSTEEEDITKKIKVPVEDPQSNDDVDDDLPF
jgi:hypothetical protein